MRSRLWISLWILGILFPMACLGRFWPAFGRVFEAAFSPSWTHIVMHACLYAALSLFLLQCIRPMSLTASLSILGVAMLVGCLQEALQALTSGEDVAWSSAPFDLLVDLGGAASVLALAWLWSFHRTGKGVQRKAG